MTTRTAQKTSLRVAETAETGWAKARHLRNKGVRTCVAAVADASAAPAGGTSSEGNIVRGED